ncbi:hypothetical protein C5167_010060 [Papaver somniferum]|uniref:Uncharacterized protein n=1 Tax=Papaver somniferum TaxID=3469 RepID=A0A4Y7K323_PAPSO|nr:hypothetical protein C5167_010060 [Papaver somniferum]
MQLLEENYFEDKNTAPIIIRIASGGGGLVSDDRIVDSVPVKACNFCIAVKACLELQLQKHPDVKCWRTKTLAHFDELAIIFGDNKANGRYSRCRNDNTVQDDDDHDNLVNV